MEAKKKFIINAAYYTVIALLITALYKYILPVMTPFLIGFSVAAMLRAPVKNLRIINERIKRVFLVLLCVLFYVALAFLTALFGAKAVSKISSFVIDIPVFVKDDLLPLLEPASDYLEKKISSFDSSLASYIDELGSSAVQQAGEFLTGFSATALKWIASGAINIPGAIIAIILTIVSTVYFAMDYDRVLKFLKSAIPESKRTVTAEGLRYAKKAVVVYVKSYSLLFTITFTELSLGMMLLGIPYPLFIALGIAAFDLMPVLGTGGVLLPWAVILLFMGNTPLGFGILTLYIIISIVRNTLEPKIVGTQIGLHPLATLIALILGLKLVGIVGMIAFPVTLVAVMNMRKQSAGTMTR